MYARRENQNRQEAQFPETGRLRSLIGNLAIWLLRLAKPILAVVFIPLSNDSFEASKAGWKFDYISCYQRLGKGLKTFDKLLGRWKMKHLDIEWKETTKI